MRQTTLLISGIIPAAAMLAFSSTVHAQALPAWTEGTISVMWADPSDLVVQLNGNGPCGTNFFHLKRSSANFQEFTALMLTAAASGRTIKLNVVNCEGERNVISHGAVTF